MYVEMLLEREKVDFNISRNLLIKEVEDEFLNEIEMESLDLETTKFHRLFTYC